MTITLSHTIVRARDKQQAARFFADLLGLDFGESAGPFAPVRVNNDLTMLFDDRNEFQFGLFGHYAFLVDDVTFDELLAQLEGSPIDYGSGPRLDKDRKINHLGGGRGVYVRDPDGNSYEFFTVIP